MSRTADVTRPTAAQTHREHLYSRQGQHRSRLMPDGGYVVELLDNANLPHAACYIDRKGRTRRTATQQALDPSDNRWALAEYDEHGRGHVVTVDLVTMLDATCWVMMGLRP